MEKLEYNGKRYYRTEGEGKRSCKGCSFAEEPESSHSHCNRWDGKEDKYTFFEHITCENSDMIFKEIFKKGIKRNLEL